MEEKRTAYARTGTATSIIVHRGGTGEKGKGKVTMGFMESFSKQRVKDMVGNAVENAEPP